MVYLISASNHLPFLKDLTIFPISRPFPFVGIINFPKSSHFGYRKVIKTTSWTCFCKGVWDSEKGLEVKLEEEILEFMKGTDKPGDFPTKAELVEAGRRDLVEGILKRGGWLSIGWDLEEEEMEIEGIGDGRDMSQENGEMGSDFGEVVRGFNENVDSFEEDSSWVSSSSRSPSFSGRSFDMKDEGGVEGILTRLEKERNLSFILNLGRQPLSRYNSDEWLMEASRDDDSYHLRESPRFSSGSSSEGILTNLGGMFSPSKSLSDVDGENLFANPEYEEDAPLDGMIAVTEGSSESRDIRTRLQHLELQLASTLSSLRSKSKELISKEGNETIIEIQKLSDALEFQETEIMNAKDSLRSIRAKLAVLEGKVTLAIIDARKTIDEKQRTIDGAHRAMQLLRTTSIIWPNSASEVLLVGSFDGWTTQRRMKKSSSGIFSVDLKLYPGKYEIKFVVDGVWKVDPLRPIVKNGGHENNIFIVT